MQVASLNSYCSSCSPSHKIQNHQIKSDLSLNARFVALEFQSTEISGSNAGIQSALFDIVNNNKDMLDFFNGIDSNMEDLGYKGKPILDLSTDEASALLSNDGFFSVENTASRVADFVIIGAGGDAKMLKSSREGIIKGFEQAEKMWGGKLPDIAYDTQKLTLEKIDKTIQELGGNILNLTT